MRKTLYRKQPEQKLTELVCNEFRHRCAGNDVIAKELSFSKDIAVYIDINKAKLAVYNKCG